MTQSKCTYIEIGQFKWYIYIYSYVFNEYTQMCALCIIPLGWSIEISHVNNSKVSVAENRVNKDSVFRTHVKNNKRDSCCALKLPSMNWRMAAILPYRRQWALSALIASCLLPNKSLCLYPALSNSDIQASNTVSMFSGTASSILKKNKHHQTIAQPDAQTSVTQVYCSTATLEHFLDKMTTLALHSLHTAAKINILKFFSTTDIYLYNIYFLASPQGLKIPHIEFYNSD